MLVSSNIEIFSEQYGHLKNFSTSSILQRRVGAGIFSFGRRKLPCFDFALFEIKFFVIHVFGARTLVDLKDIIDVGRLMLRAWTPRFVGRTTENCG